jgi:hypothetical protein
MYVCMYVLPMFTTHVHSKWHSPGSNGSTGMGIITKDEDTFLWLQFPYRAFYKNIPNWIFL